MDIDHPSARWLKRTRDGEGPVYLRIVDALSAAIREGELQAGDQLPPQRTVAALLGIDFTTVTRAYGLAREQGLDPAQMALAFVQSRPFIASTIIGATKMAQLDSNIGSAEVVLGRAVLKSIEEIHSRFTIPCP